jgi:hypothetical protein
MHSIVSHTASMPVCLRSILILWRSATVAAKSVQFVLAGASHLANVCPVSRWRAAVPFGFGFIAVGPTSALALVCYQAHCVSSAVILRPQVRSAK